MLGLSRGVVLRTAHDLGLPVGLGGLPPRHGPAEIELIELLTGIPAQTVRALLHHYGIPLRGPGGRSPFLRRWRASPGRTVRAVSDA